MTDTYDLLVIGSGPAGLSAAISAASEGLKVAIMDNGNTLGGQARESSAIENYPGFPDGITGNDLMQSFVAQALKFGTIVICPTTAQKLQKNADGIFTVTTDDYQEYNSKAVLLSMGLSYRRLDAKNIGPLIGRGIYYGCPPNSLSTSTPTRVAVVGGANSAGQAVVRLARLPNVSVDVIIRKRLADQMSTYLIDRISTMPNVRLCENCEVAAVEGKGHLERLWITDHLKHESKFDDYTAMYIFIGATPRTVWLRGTLDLDEHYFVRDHAYQTSMDGVFVAGDVRSGSVKRIAAAGGEGSGVVPMIHRYLAGDRHA